VPPVEDVNLSQIDSSWRSLDGRNASDKSMLEHDCGAQSQNVRISIEGELSCSTRYFHLQEIKATFHALL